jgi:hypothetical protein
MKEIAMNTVVRIYVHEWTPNKATIFFNNGKKPIHCKICIELDHINATLKYIPYERE